MMREQRRLCLRRRRRSRRPSRSIQTSSVLILDRTLAVSIVLLLFYCCSSSSSSSSFVQARHSGSISSSIQRPRILHHGGAPTTTLFHLRGGSTTTATAATATTKQAPSKDDLQAYRLQQQLYLQARSLQLRQALVSRGLDALQIGQDVKKKKLVDWDCAVSTRQHPKSCLYSFDAEPNAKVIAPIDTEQWITLSALLRLRRTDPTKVEPLWHSQYAILQSWMHPDSKYTLYTHLTPIGTLLSLLLDSPVLLASAMAFVTVLALLLTLPLWEKAIIQTLLTSNFLWLQWPKWGRFVHAALPLKLLLGQMAWRLVVNSFGRVYQDLRNRLIEWECQIWNDCIPITVVEEKDDDETVQEEEEDW